jgi:hypothetical protein
MPNSFEIDIPMKDRPMAVIVKQREKAEEANVFDIYYCDELCGCMFKNENNVWIYEPHAHAALLLDDVQIQHLGKEIGEHAYNS